MAKLPILTFRGRHIGPHRVLGALAAAFHELELLYQAVGQHLDDNRWREHAAKIAKAQAALKALSAEAERVAELERVQQNIDQNMRYPPFAERKKQLRVAADSVLERMPVLRTLRSAISLPRKPMVRVLAAAKLIRRR